MSVVEVARDTVRGATTRAFLMGLSWSGDLGAQLLDPGNRADPFAQYDRIRARGPLVESRLGLLTASHGVTGRVLRDPRFGHGEQGQTSEEAGVTLAVRPDIVDPLGPESMIGMNPPDHTRLRGLTTKVFTPRAIAGLRPRMEQLAHQLLDGPARAGGMDLMTEYATLLPVLVIAEVLGVPTEDEERFRGWNTDLAASLDWSSPPAAKRRAQRALVQLEGYFGELFERRRRDPGDDLLSRMLAVEEEGDRLTARELMATAVLLLLAGFETTVNVLGNGTLALLRHPNQRGLLRDKPDLVANAVEEILRWDGPVQLTARQALEPVELEGAGVAPGTMVITLLAGANRDPAVFDDPAAFCVDRANARQHLSFAAGAHHCLGAALARLESEVALRALLDRFPTLGLAGRPVRRPTFILRGLTSLPLRAGDRTA